MRQLDMQDGKINKPLIEKSFPAVVRATRPTGAPNGVR
jgi:hypothetical protein